MAPEETTTEQKSEISANTQTPAVTEATKPVENGGTEVDPFENATKGIKDRLTRLTKQIEKNQIEPLKQQIAALEAVLDKHGIEREEVVQESTPAEKTEQVVEKEAGGTEKPVDMVQYYRTKAAFEAGLPQEALPFLTGSTEDEIVRQAEMLKTLNFWGRGRRIISPIRPDGSGDTAPLTFKRSQMQDATFVIKNRKEIQKAVAEGRIINDL
jgi:hypothetical protein